MVKKQSFSITHPHLLEEWDYRKNQLLGLEPENLTYGSKKKAWWICKNGHSWEAVLHKRASGRGCHYCSNHKVGYGNDLLTNQPALCEEWDSDKNKLGPENFFPGSQKKVWWKCKEEHSWEATILSRTYEHGCPYCSGRFATHDNNILVNSPKLCKEWDYEKNKLGPDKYLTKSNKKVWWKCSKGHSWKASIHNRTQGNGCQYCANKAAGYGNDLLTTHSDIAKEWDYDKNKITPDQVVYGSNKNVWWKCSKGHSWKTFVFNRTIHKTGCPYCSNQAVGYGNDLLKTYPELCLEWDYQKNKLGPDEIVPGSRKKIWWKCDKGHSWKAFVYNRAFNGTGCPKCSKRISKPSQKWLDSLDIKKREVRLEIPYGNRKFMFVDGFDPETNTIYEFLGDYWHGNPKIFSAGKNAHNNKSFDSLFEESMKKLKAIQEYGYNVIYIWENDFIT